MYQRAIYENITRLNLVNLRVRMACLEKFDEKAGAAQNQACV